MEQTKKSRMHEELDLLTALPIILAHSIIALLPSQYAARSLAVSKNWGLLWKTSPVINLDENDFKDDDASSREKFIKCLQFLLRHHRFVKLEKLRIQTIEDRPESIKFFGLIDTLLGEASGSKVLNEIDLELSFSFGHPYAITEKVFSFKTLICLKLGGCTLREPGVIRLPLLKILSLKTVFVQKDFLQNLMVCCPALETFVFWMCHDLRKIEIRHSKLAHLDIGECNGLASLRFDVPSLLSFKYEDSIWISNRAFENAINNGFCLRSNSLRSIVFEHVQLQAKTLNDIVSANTDIDSLTLKNCLVFGVARIRSDRLRTLLMSHCYLEKDPYIKAPNLESFTLRHNIHVPVKLSGKIFEGLTSLFLFDIRLEDETLSFTKSNFPGLVTLTIISCRGFKQLKVISSTVEYLSVEQCTLERWEIVAQCLSTLVYTGTVLEQRSLITPGKLDALLDLKYECENCHDKGKLEQFLSMFTQIGDLALTMTLECPQCLLILTDVTVAPVNHIKHLKVIIEGEETNVEFGLVDLLRSLLCVTLCCNSMSLEFRSVSILLEFREIEASDIFEMQKSPWSCLGFIRDHLVKLTVKNLGVFIYDELMMVYLLLREVLRLRHVGIFLNEERNAKLWTRGIMKAWTCARMEEFPSIEFWETNFIES